MRRALLAVAIGLVVVLAVGFGVWKLRGASTVRFDTPYQAVLLDTGLVYYGKIQGLGTPFPVLTDVYYVEHQENPQTKEVKNILVRRGNEWHAPDRMVINARHIVLVEPVSPGSKVASLIVDLSSKRQ